MNPKSLIGKLYIIATPIGNLEDITFRAVRILKEIDLILCEDTRVTSKLLKQYQINTPTTSYHSKSSFLKAERFINMLKDGKNLALVSDAGTPGISDPGSLLLSEIYNHNMSMGTIDTKKIEIIAIPGPSALISALSISGFKGNSFVFDGFLPHKKGRETLFKKIAVSDDTHIFYESPHRILKTLESLNQFTPKKKIMIARELTKMFEETLFGKASEIIEIFQKNPEKLKGEFVVMVFGKD